MNKLDKYKRYYPTFLERYLFEEVSVRFRKETPKYLTFEEFMVIVIWKRPASKTKVVNGLIDSKLSIDRATRKINFSGEPEEMLKELKSVNGIGISIASAIMTVCYPENYTILDYRAFNSLMRLSYWPNAKRNEKIKESKQINTLGVYLEYVDVCKKVMENNKPLTLRQIDQCLWGMDFDEDEEGGLGDLLKHLSNKEPYNSACKCSDPDCAKCLGINCRDKNCLTHTNELKEAWRRRWEQANKKIFPYPKNY